MAKNAVALCAGTRLPSDVHQLPTTAEYTNRKASGHNARNFVGLLFPLIYFLRSLGSLWSVESLGSLAVFRVPGGSVGSLTVREPFAV